MLLLLVACSDFTLELQKDDPPPFDAGTTPEVPTDTASTDTPTGTTPTDPLDCDLAVPVAGLATDSVSCGSAPVADPWNLTLRDRWLGPSPDLMYMSEQVITANLTDDNGDGRMDGDDVSDLVIIMGEDVCVSATTHLIALNGDDLSVIFDVIWPYLDAHTAPAIGDVDGDGSPDIVVQTDLTATVMFNARGEEQWSSEELMQYNLPGPSLTDLDGDGQVEVLVSKAVFDGATGDLLRILIDNYGGAAVAANLDLSGDAETIYDGYVYDVDGNVVGDAPYRGEYQAVWDVDGDPATGEVIWTSQRTLYAGDASWHEVWSVSGVNLFGPPTVADLDGDGSAEVVAATDGGTIHAWDKAGTERWRVSLPFEVPPGIAAGDLDNDGDYELVVAGSRNLVILDGDGAVLWTSEAFPFVSTPAFATYPVLTDLDDDGSTEIVHVIEEQVGGQYSSQLLVWSHTDGAWPKMADTWSEFSLTPGVRNMDGSVPPAAAPSWVGPELFRGWPSAALGLADLRVSVMDVCAESCEAGAQVGVAVQVANVGTVAAPAGTPVTLYRDDGGAHTPLQTLPLPATLDAGATSDGLVFTVSLADVGTTGFHVGVDDGGGVGVVAECEEADNTDDWGELPCP